MREMKESKIKKVKKWDQQITSSTLVIEPSARLTVDKGKLELKDIKNLNLESHDHKHQN